MNRKMVGLMSLATAILLGNLLLADDMSPSPPATQPTTQPMAAIDLRNTICPVSKEAVASSNNVVVYDGKVYHLCCPDCHVDFAKDPDKYAKAVADDPAKYGVK